MENPLKPFVTFQCDNAQAKKYAEEQVEEVFRQYKAGIVEFLVSRLNHKNTNPPNYTFQLFFNHYMKRYYNHDLFIDINNEGDRTFGILGDVTLMTACDEDDLDDHRFNTYVAYKVLDHSKLEDIIRITKLIFDEVRPSFGVPRNKVDPTQHQHNRQTYLKMLSYLH